MRQIAEGKVVELLKLLERFADLMFLEMPPGIEMERAKAEILNTLESDYAQNLKDGMTPDGALAQTLVCFGALDAAEKAYQRQILSSRFERFKKLYRLLHYGGLAAILVLPMLSLVLLTGFHFRAAAVVVWLLSILFFAAFLIALEWRRAYYRRQTEPSVEEETGTERSDTEDGK